MSHKQEINEEKRRKINEELSDAYEEGEINFDCYLDLLRLEEKCRKINEELSDAYAKKRREINDWYEEERRKNNDAYEEECRKINDAYDERPYRDYWYR